MNKPSNQTAPSVCTNNNQNSTRDHFTGLGRVVPGIVSIGIDREELEGRAKKCCPAALWYDLLDNLDETSDKELLALIEQYEC